MASIQGYLARLESRLAPSLDAQALQERLTEAEVHLRDRAQEFEEIGLPSLEAEARAVAAFGDPEEFAEDVVVRPVTPVQISTRVEPNPRDLALQLAWSVVGLGLVSMLVADGAYWVATGFAIAFMGLGALLGRPTPIRRMAILASTAAMVAFPILLGFYEPLPYNSVEPERIGVRLKGSMRNMDRYYREAQLEERRFERASGIFHRTGKVVDGRSESYGDLVVSDSDGQIQSLRSFIGPSTSIEDPSSAWRNRSYGPPPETLQSYDTQEEAASHWKTDETTVRAWISNYAEELRPIQPALTVGGRLVAFALLALAGGTAFLAAMAGVQAMALVLRGFFAWLVGGLRRRPEREVRYRRAPIEPERY